MITDNIPEKLSYDYQFVKKIGEGANGETWLARNRFTNKLAAIKCLRLNKLDDVKVIELFERESELLKSVHVAGVPLFFDYYSPVENGSGYLVQEYIQAPSIQDLLDQNVRFDESEVLLIAEKLADILYHLEIEYQPPIIHRDIKPSNILYQQTNSTVYLIDFGAVANPQKRTGGSTVAGTFGYMAPEQIMGEVKIQSDFYSLGASLLHMMTGVPPYELDSELFKIDVEKAFTDRQINASPGMKKLLSMLLNPDMDKRPQNALALMDEIRSVQEANHYRAHLWPKILRLLKKAAAWLLPIQTRSTAPAELMNNSELLTIHNIERGFALVDPRYGCKFVTRNWIRCDGVLRQFAQVRGPTHCMENSLEYTFEAQNTVWNGYCLLIGLDSQNLNKLQSQMIFPGKCSVLYNPRDPRENGLELIYDSDNSAAESLTKP